MSRKHEEQDVFVITNDFQILERRGRKTPQFYYVFNGINTAYLNRVYNELKDDSSPFGNSFLVSKLKNKQLNHSFNSWVVAGTRERAVEWIIEKALIQHRYHGELATTAWQALTNPRFQE